MRLEGPKFEAEGEQRISRLEGSGECRKLPQRAQMHFGRIKSPENESIVAVNVATFKQLKNVATHPGDAQAHTVLGRDV